MELQTFIDNNPNWLELMKENNLKIRKYNKYNCVLISHYYNKPLNYENEDEYWKMYCRGAIIKDNRVICVPPVKSKEITLDYQKPGDYEYQYLIDGTMINLFYIDNKWLISTRSEIGGYNKWKDKKSFRKMFDECVNFDINTLNKEYSYSFVMRHVDNVNISSVTKNEIYLVELYNLKDLQRVSNEQYPNNIQAIQNIQPIDSNILKLNCLDFQFKGITIKQGTKRYKYINPLFTEVSELIKHSNNPLIDYLELRKNGNLKKYLQYFPKKSKVFNKYRDQIHELTNELYSKYKNVYVFKKEERNTLPYHLKPFISEIHQVYKSTGVPLSFHFVKDYIHNLPSKRIVFSLQNKK